MESSHLKSDSSIEAKPRGVKIIAPALFIYGIAALIVAIGITVYYQEIKEKELTETEARQNRGSIKDLSSDNFSIGFYTYKPVSIFGGTVLIAIEGGELKFTGIKGASESVSGPFNKSNIEINEDRKIFIMTADSTKYGINVLEYKTDTQLEFYKINKIKKSISGC
jgi:hypothetical protein